MSDKNKTCGRPCGRIKTSKIEVSIEPEIKSAFMEKLRSEGRKASTEISIWIREYLKSKEQPEKRA